MIECNISMTFHSKFICLKYHFSHPYISLCSDQQQERLIIPRLWLAKNSKVVFSKMHDLMLILKVALITFGKGRVQN